INNLREDAAAFKWISQHHVYNLIIAGVTERLGEGPIRKRGTEHERMQMPLEICLVRRKQFCIDLGCDFFEFFEEPIDDWHNGASDLFQDLLLELGSVSGRSGTQTPFDLREAAPKLTYV